MTPSGHMTPGSLGLILRGELCYKSRGVADPSGLLIRKDELIVVLATMLQSDCVSLDDLYVLSNRCVTWIAVFSRDAFGRHTTDVCAVR